MMTVVPVLNKDGTILLIDMYVGGIWHGSRRTADQVEQYRLYLERKRW